MQARFFTSPNEIRAAWPQVSPVLARLPAVDDFTLADLERLALAGTLALGVVTQSESIQLVMAFEVVPYPNRLAVNIVALAGSGLATVAQRFFQQFCAGCRQMGAHAIEARCSDSMARLLRRYGFGKVYNVVRMNWEY